MEFIVTRDDSDLELQHHGTKGMKWGIRRFQNKDGSLTPEGKKRRSLGQVIRDHKVKKKRKAALEKARATKEEKKKLAEEEKAKAEKRAKDLAAGKISAKKMTDAELADALRRKENEKKYNEAMLATSPGKRFVSKMWNDAIVPGMAEGGKKVVSNFVEKKISDVLGLNTKEAKSEYEKLKEAADMAKFKKLKWQDERDLAEAKKKYADHLEEEKLKKAQKEVDDYNAEQEKKNSSKSEPYNKKGSSLDNNKDKTDNTERFEATGDDIVGEGKSTSKYKNQHGSLGGSSKKSDDYYDPIDVDAIIGNANKVASNLPAARKKSGRNFIEELY